MMAENESDYVDLDSICLTPDDIDDPAVHIDIKKLTTYSMPHLKQWLIFRGDSLRTVHLKKDARIRVLHYVNGGLTEKIVDPTPDKKWLKQKAEQQNLKIKPSVALQKEKLECPKDFLEERNHLQRSEGWTKSLENIPKVSINNITNYVERINTSIVSKATVIKKNFQRGEKFFEENYVDINSIHAKQNNNFFCIKGICAASLRQKDRWILIVISKENAEIEYAHCQCPAGNSGTCAHTYALMKIVAKWILDGCTGIPEAKPCTSKPCVWSVPQHRGKVQKVPVDQLEIKSPENKARKIEKSISSTLYDVEFEKTEEQGNNIQMFVSRLSETSPDIHFLDIVSNSNETTIPTKYGSVTLGSFLSYQVPLVPPDFQVYANLPPPSKSELQRTYSYPDFPFTETDTNVTPYLNDIKSLEKLKFLEALHVTYEDIVRIERETREQAACPTWFEHRINRFTASLCNKLKNVKTVKGLENLAVSLTTPTKPKSNILQIKLDHGKFYKPIAISSYEKYLKSFDYYVLTEPSGLVIDKNNFMLGASPDGKTQVDGLFGIIEVKCSEEFKDVDPKSICFISNNSCLVYDENLNKILLNKNHSYYDQVQMQLALTCQTWCDFIFYTNKGIVIDRIPFDKAAWIGIRDRILNFYFNHMLDKLVVKQAEKIHNKIVNDEICIDIDST